MRWPQIGSSRTTIYLPEGDFEGRVFGLQWGRLLIEFAVAKAEKLERACRVCGCTEDSACFTDEGPCGWAEADLCTACVEE